MGKTDWMRVKLDLEKAYDQINWSFLRAVLVMEGCSDYMVELIMVYVTLASLFVLWNGEKLEAFRPGKGLRQGDPLSSYMFVLCMVVLGQKILCLVLTKEWRTIKLSKSGPAMSHLFFANDMFLFRKASKQQATVMATLLGDFFRFSGQKENMAKSKLYMSWNTNRAVELALSLN